MDTNPYAPPKAAVADVVPPGLKRRSVILMIVFVVLTLGLYYPIWFLRRRGALNRLDSPRKLALWPFVVYGVVFVFEFARGFLAGVSPGQQPLGDGATLVLSLIQLAVGILMLVQCFVIKDILEDHLAGPGDGLPNPMFVESVKLSGLLTFFFQIFYLQWAINRYIARTPSSL